MANELALIILSGTGTDWDVERNHHRCICHVIALILGAGLKALNVSRKMVCPEKADKAFPSLAPYIEEVKTGPKDEIIEVIDIIFGVRDEERNNGGNIGITTSDEEEVDPDDAAPDAVVDGEGWEENNSNIYDNAEDLENSTGIAFTLKKDCILTQKQAKWKVWAAKISYTGRGREYEGRRVIKQLIENENERLAGKSAKDHFFKSYKLYMELSSREWEDINTLNHILKVSNREWFSCA
ncbi:hypothetical protein KEM48_004249 [Puccinia striiformis f. sp. tritici PST-130]|nr:hypothetical protein KEM48_004249 [Puccinia striiformis f. sp. tritici PST-130]